MQPTGPFSFEAPYSWSLLKLEIMEKYANTLAGIMGGRRRVCFVDLMAGEGYYATGDAGSAGRLAEIAHRHRDANRSVHVIAIEANGDAFTKLMDNTVHVREFIDVRHGQWQDHVQSLLVELRNEFVFFFVDPMGVVELPWSDLAPLVTRQDTELLINFNSSIASRLAGFVLKGQTAGGYATRLTAVMGNDDWLDGAVDARARHETPNHMAHAYLTRIQRVGGYGVCSAPIAREGDRGQHKYHLIFASRNIKAFEIMNDILAIQRERIRRDRATASTERTFFPQTATEYDTEREHTLVNSLAESLLKDSSLAGWSGTIEELRAKTFGARFGQFKYMLYASAVTLLFDRSQIEIIGEEKRRQGKLQLKVRVRFR